MWMALWPDVDKISLEDDITRELISHTESKINLRRKLWREY